VASGVIETKRLCVLRASMSSVVKNGACEKIIGIPAVCSFCEVTRVGEVFPSSRM
jgi:hypothetical protein